MNQRFDNLDSRIEALYVDLKRRIDCLDAELKQFISTGYFGSLFNAKEEEIRRLKNEVSQIEREHLPNPSPTYIPKAFPYTPSYSFIPQSPPTPSYRQPDYSKHFKSTTEILKRHSLIPSAPITRRSPIPAKPLPPEPVDQKLKSPFVSPDQSPSFLADPIPEIPIEDNSDVSTEIETSSSSPD
ncbi:proline-rich receptor-like protein kinase PERK2 [Malania oleifera]|uniref:proline-rich receptor-like protein kinase PERK2 n=1 Tax=Malania oleifera TaxID=397392 RepID=UPI0025ADC14E|nr:proline-rich receptor-like protein kinase PERK2 [Malania oleifera]